MSFSNKTILKEEYFGITSLNFQINLKTMSFKNNYLNHTGLKTKGYKTPYHTIIYWKAGVTMISEFTNCCCVKKYRFSTWSIHEALYQINSKVLLFLQPFISISHEKWIITKCIVKCFHYWAMKEWLGHLEKPL